MSLWDCGINKLNCINSFSAIHIRMLELKNDKHNTYYRCSYLPLIYHRCGTETGSNQDCKALQRVVRLSERILGSALPSLQDIYLKGCKSRDAKIIKNSSHPGNRFFILLPSGKRFCRMMAKRRSFFPQAIGLLNSNSV